jgi:hypothetical protein
MTLTDTTPKPATPGTDDMRLAHLVLKDSWPTALCGATVTDHFGTRAPAMDRCPACMRIARDRGLGRPGWAFMGS